MKRFYSIVLILLLIITFPANVFSRISNDSISVNQSRVFKFHNGEEELKIVIGQRIRVWWENHPSVTGTLHEINNEEITIINETNNFHIQIKIIDIRKVVQFKRHATTTNEYFVIKNMHSGASHPIYTGRRLRINHRGARTTGIFVRKVDKGIILLDKKNKEVYIDFYSMQKLRILNKEGNLTSATLKTLGYASTILGAGFAIFIASGKNGYGGSEGLDISFGMMVLGLVMNESGNYAKNSVFKLGVNWMIYDESTI